MDAPSRLNMSLTYRLHLYQNMLLHQLSEQSRLFVDKGRSESLPVAAQSLQLSSYTPLLCNVVKS